MLEKMSYGDLPVQGRQNANRRFAEAAVAEFARLTCDAAKVTGWPLNNRSIEAKRAALKRAIKDKSLGARISTQADSEYCYLVRIR